MVYKYIQPSVHLEAYVKHYLLLHFRMDRENPQLIKSYAPCPEQCLTFNPRATLMSINQQTGEVNRRTSNYLSGQQVSRLNLHLADDYLMLKVVFQPGAMYQIFEVPLAFFTDQYLDTETVIGSEIRTINEQMANADSYEKLIETAEIYLWKKIKKSRTEANAVNKIGQLIIDNPTRFSLDWLAAQACWSPRHLQRQFVERMGVSPKFLARISRFDKAFLLKQRNPKLDWLSISLISGYSDYQHMVKDFKQFAGTNPNEMFLAERQSPERVLGLVPEHMSSR
ncbi:helix-turn-helix domain-containing protein [Dyadobacter arcticus]|uniref:AraC-like DNA-binding protein n=1 Tax=Dyadobacter arcticus TaxID=1078754 RepID=A0ABX0URN8_9BACT|nr:helix-turn-helix domain-containing protein [Dyadobacter arcticus]NIJ55661.1 AraC-like DNA-binding protein [Dyadobacter arcticus]